jgi:hypothetical protein
VQSSRPARRVVQGRERQSLTRLFASARRCSTSPKMLTLEAWASSRPMNTFGPERSFFFVSETWDYVFLGLLAFTVDLTEPLELTFVFGASTAVRVSALSVSAVSRALCAALRWLARRFISFALCAPRIGSSIASAFIGESTFSPLTPVILL